MPCAILSRDLIKDKFRIEKLDNKLITHYRSPNRHCHLYVSLADVGGSAERKQLLSKLNASSETILM